LESTAGGNLSVMGQSPASKTSWGRTASMDHLHHVHHLGELGGENVPFFRLRGVLRETRFCFSAETNLIEVPFRTQNVVSPPPSAAARQPYAQQVSPDSLVHTSSGGSISLFYFCKKENFSRLLGYNSAERPHARTAQAPVEQRIEAEVAELQRREDELRWVKNFINIPRIQTSTRSHGKQCVDGDNERRRVNTGGKRQWRCGSREQGSLELQIGT